MREIKFRVWDKQYNQMLYIGREFDEHIHEKEPSHYMQYTGLKDKNGVEIYEKDIVHLSSEDGMNYNALIVFEDGAFCAIDGTEDDYGVRRYGLMRYELQMEIIGNIYENPNLIEVDNT